MRIRSRTLFPLLLAAPVLSACGAENRADASWAGSADTLASGQIVVRNTARPLWRLS